MNPVVATSVSRELRGQSRAKLVHSDDGSYVVKSVISQSCARLLANEWLAASLMRRVGIATPDTRVVRFAQGVPSSNLGTLHFGSCFPGNPSVDSVYDYLPAALHHRIVNRSDFVKVLAFDVWVGKRDTRQAIFARVVSPCEVAKRFGAKGSFFAQMVDNKLAFGGASWTFDYLWDEVQPVGMDVLREPDAEEVLRRTANFIGDLPAAAIWEDAAGVPGEWIDGSERDFEGLVDELCWRRKVLADVVEEFLHRKAACV